MARSINRLTARAVANAGPGKHHDGGGLYLNVDDQGSRWSLLYTFAGRRREMGLGSTMVVRLARAREMAAEARELLTRDVDPIEARRVSRRGSAPAFGPFAEGLIADLEKGWRGSTADSWRRCVSVYAAKLANRPLDTITTDDVLDVLKPMWGTMPDSAGKTRERIERVLDAAKAKGLRSGENPARWRGHLDQLLPKRPKLTRGHHKALPWRELPAFMARLRRSPGISARALEWTILTAARENMTLGARWREVEGGDWTIPAERMKGGKREHIVPLSAAMLALLDTLRPPRPDPDALIFPSPLRPRAMSNAAMDRMLGLIVTGYTVHGFRSTFSDWVGDATEFPRELRELALAHAVGDATERTYRRGHALERRRALMEAWTEFCG